MSAILTLALLMAVGFFWFVIGLSILILKKEEKRLRKGEFFRSSFGKIFYRKLGRKGPYVLLIHGLGASGYCWRHVAERMSGQYQCLVIDLWGFGRSTKKNHDKMSLDSQTQVIQELLDHHNIRTYHVVGHSMGGQIALWLALNDKRVDKCFALEPASHPSLVSVFLDKNRWMANFTPFIVNKNLVQQMVRRVLTNTSILTPEMVKKYARPYRDPRAHLCFAAALGLIRDPRVFNQLAELDENTLVVWGGKDVVITPKTASKISHRLTKARTMISPESGHLPMEDDPATLTEQIFTHLKS